MNCVLEWSMIPTCIPKKFTNAENFVWNSLAGNKLNRDWHKERTWNLRIDGVSACTRRVTHGCVSARARRVRSKYEAAHTHPATADSAAACHLVSPAAPAAAAASISPPDPAA